MGQKQVQSYSRIRQSSHEQSDLQKNYKINFYPQFRKDVDTTTEQYKAYIERQKFIAHLFADHQLQYYQKSCSEAAHTACKKMCIYKEEQDPQPIKKTKKIEKMIKQSGFMSLTIGFGKQWQKPWLYVQEHKPRYINWLAESPTMDIFNKDIAKVIIQEKKQ